MSSVLCVGLVCMDIIVVTENYPAEDSDQRAKALHWRRGGNAATTSVVLSNLGSRVEFICPLPRFKSGDLSLGSTTARIALQDLNDHGVGTANVSWRDCTDFPTSTIVVDRKNGSRTSVHHRGGLEELVEDDFRSLDLDKYRWIHFEGRPNAEVIENVVAKIAEANRTSDNMRVKISIELEKPRSTLLLEACKNADLVFVSKVFAIHMGYGTATDAVAGMKKKFNLKGELVCMWGEVGTAYITSDASDCGLIEANVCKQVVDTTGAGDSFIGGMLHCRSKGYPLPHSVRFGCRVAERKITDFGFDHVTTMNADELFIGEPEGNGHRE